MKVRDFHLTYCSNIHAGESWNEVDARLRDVLPRMRGMLSFDGPFAIGLRLSAAAAAALEEPPALERFRDFLHNGHYYVPTINGFPYGAFHGTRVKERVYVPDWRTPERLAYSNRLARLLAALLEHRPDIEGSISTVPCGFGEDVASEDDLAAAVAGILRHAAFLKRLREQTGITIALALEPEPACVLETAEDAVRFFQHYLFAADQLAAISRETGTTLTSDDVRTHVGVCLDTCHMAVEFEEPHESLRRLLGAGIQVRKVQISSALEMIAGVHGDPNAILPRFAEDVYLHQVVLKKPSGLVRYTDLPEALAAARLDGNGAEWRVHFHVPVFLAAMEETGTTQNYLLKVIDMLRDQPFCPMLEVETYTWDVLPPEYRTVDVCTAIARELSWVAAALQR